MSRVYILSRNSKLYSTSRLVEEGRKQGMRVRVVDTLKLSLLTGTDDGGKIIYRGDSIRIPDMVVPRIGASVTTFGGCVMFQFERMGVPLLNGSSGMFNTRDKLRCTQILSSNGVPTPKTLLLRRISKKEMGASSALEGKTKLKDRVAKVIEAVGGAPCIIKLNKGTQGVGVVLCKTMNDVYQQVDVFWKTQQDFIIQEFVRESSGKDVRALVIGDRVVASMKRESKTGDFRSNTHQGGEASEYRMSAEAQAVAVKAARLVGLRVAGVDMLFSGKNSFKVLEVNSSPGFEGLEKATKINVARAIMTEVGKGISYSKTLKKMGDIPDTLVTPTANGDETGPPF